MVGQGWVAAGSLERITDSQLCASYARTMRGLVFAVRRWVWSFAKKDVFAFRDGLEGHLELCPKVFSRFGVFSKAIWSFAQRCFRVSGWSLRPFGILPKGVFAFRDGLATGEPQESHRRATSALGAQTTPGTKTRKPDNQNLIFPWAVVI